MWQQLANNRGTPARRSHAITLAFLVLLLLSAQWLETVHEHDDCDERFCAVCSTATDAEPALVGTDWPHLGLWGRQTRALVPVRPNARAYRTQLIRAPPGHV